MQLVNVKYKKSTAQVHNLSLNGGWQITEHKIRLSIDSAESWSDAVSVLVVITLTVPGVKDVVYDVMKTSDQKFWKQKMEYLKKKKDYYQQNY